MKTGVVFTIVAVALSTASAAPPAATAASAEQSLKAALVGRQVIVPFDVPVSLYGVDFDGDEAFARDEKARFERIDMWGMSIRGGDTATITDVRVSRKRIELVLDRGGLSTTDLMRLKDPAFEVGSSVSVPEDQSAHTTHPAARRAELERVMISGEIGGSAGSRAESAQNYRASVDTSGKALRRLQKSRAWIYRPGLGSRLRVLYDDEVPAAMLNPEAFVKAMSEHVMFVEPARAPGPGTP